MEMHQIKYFLAVTRTLNFTRAADQCNVTQPSLTRAIQKLEEEFGGLLFNRERALTHLTELGRMVLPHLEQTFEAAEAATSLASSIGRAEVTPLVIGVAHGVASPVMDEILGSLVSSLPGLTIDLRTGTSVQLIEMSLKGGMDLLLITLANQTPDRLETWPLYTQGLRVAAWNEHKHARTSQPTMSEAAAEEWFDLGDDATVVWREAAVSAGLVPNFRHRVEEQCVALRLIALRLGLAVVAAGTEAAGVVLIDLADKALSLNVVLAAVAGRRRGRAADAFLRAARARKWRPYRPNSTDQSDTASDDSTSRTAAGSAR